MMALHSLDASQEDLLCSNCRQLDFRYILNKNSDVKIVLGTVDEVRGRDCAFCQRFTSTIFWTSPFAEALTVSGEDTIHLSARKTDYSGWEQVPRGQTSDFSTLEFTVFQNIRTPENPLNISVVNSDPVSVVVDGLYNDGPMLSLRTVPERYEVATIQGWLQDCIESVPKTAIVENEALLDLRCIDVVNQCLADVEVGVPFVALSYVWGKPSQSTVLSQDNIAQLRQKNAISPTDTRFPRTIRDAMMLCKELGICYLWVDALCIIQDSPDKLKQIQQLHIIYQRAQFTIVAANGDDAEAGLPGVGPESRPQHQQISNIQGFRLVQKSLDLDIALLPSYWRTRAWTFQEFLLSPRKLVFTQHRIYFSCPHGVRTEDLRAPDHSSASKYGRKLVQSGLEFDLDNSLNWTTYATLVSNYTTKNLSYKMDVIPAFTALATTLSQELFSSTNFLFDIPLCMLDAGLLWRRCIWCDKCQNPEDGIEARRGNASDGDSSNQRLPSWSWAGWIGHVRYSDWILQSENPSTTILSRVTWLGVSPDDLQILPAEVTGKPNDTWQRWNSWSEKTVRGVKAYVRENGNPNRLFCHPVEAESTQSRIPLDPSSGILFFIGEVASFTVYKRVYTGPGRRREKEPFPNAGIGNSHGNPLAIWDPKDGSHVGLVYDDRDIAKSLGSPDSPVRCSFIKLSQTTMSPKDEDPAYNPETKQYEGTPGGPSVNPEAKPNVLRGYFDDKKYDWNISWCLYNVLMVIWVDGIAIRIGIGKIHIHAFDKASPERRKILLG